MLAETLVGTGAFVAGGFVYAKSRRARLYREAADRIAQISHASEPDLTALKSRSLPDFVDHLAVLPDFLQAQSFAALAAEAERLASPERSFVPAHKQGGTVAYETLIAAAPAIVASYHSAGLRGSHGRSAQFSRRSCRVHRTKRRLIHRFGLFSRHSGALLPW